MKLASAWKGEHLTAIQDGHQQRIPVIGAGDVKSCSNGLDLWDMWPLTSRNGALSAVKGGVLWFILSAPRLADPAQRHAVARIRLMLQQPDGWVDCGNALPDDLSPGSREWAGSAILDPQSLSVTLFFTAAGRSEEAETTFEQRLFQSSGTLDLSGPAPCIRNWSAPAESVASDDRIYVRANQSKGKAGTIKAFRDPAYFRDPANGVSYLLFAGSLRRSLSAFNGCVGLAQAAADDLSSWRLMPPLLEADSVNNELERPHVVFSGDRYYLFWSTQTSTFAPDVSVGPNGLYGAVATHFLGPYRPLNGSGLVCGNPQEEPTQAYSWLVLNTLEVVSFVDYWGLQGRSPGDDQSLLRSHFGGVPAPRFKLRLSGETAGIAL